MDLEFPIFGQKGEKGGVLLFGVSILSPTLRPTTPKTIQNHMLLDLGRIFADLGQFFDDFERFSSILYPF
jgi:hypothetical protein